MTDPRAILHVDMDAFFASVEQRDDPALRGRPVLVGHDGPRGVVAAASYEARAFGCHSAQPIAVAKRLCPDAVIRHPRGRQYGSASKQVFAILGAATPLVQPLSIDEAFLDVTGSIRLLGPPRAIAQSIKARVARETGLTASVGIAPNKFLAKLASDLEKPDGLTEITPGDIETRIAALPITRMWGVGPAMERRLATLGIRTFGDVQRLSREAAVGLIGAAGDHFWHLARGEDDREVVPDGRAKSIGTEQTFGADITVPTVVRSVLWGQCEGVGMRLRDHALRGRTVTVKIRFGDFETISRSTSLDRATDRTDRIGLTAAALFDRWATRSFRPVRLIGATVSNLESAAGRQMELFIDPASVRSREIDRVTDTIRHRFGRLSIHRGMPYTEQQ